VVDEVIDAARIIRKNRYAGAMAAFAAGSIVRGEGTPYSDLDLVVVYPHVACAYRESFRVRNLPVEAFVHDPETLNYFFLEVDRKAGVPSLPRMVVEGIEIPDSTDASRSLKELAASVLAMGPPPLSRQDRDALRYGVTDLVDDIREPRSRDELTAAGAKLFEVLANYYLRTRDLWSATGKSIPRALKGADAALSVRYCRSFEALFTRGEVDSVIALAEELLAPDGGPLFDGYRLDAPAEWRKPIADGSA
jgi:predicted nucleotidyltransferase